MCLDRHKVGLCPQWLSCKYHLQCGKVQETQVQPLGQEDPL